MKVRIAGLMVLVMALFVGSASAQPMIDYGVTAGWGLASISDEDDFVGDVVSDMRNGLDVGAYVEIPVNNMFSVVVAGKYAQKGATGTFNEDGFTGDSTVKLDYIDIPILANFPINTMGSVRPFVYAGVVPAFAVNRKVKAEFEGGEDEEDLKDDIKSFDTGLMFGGGVQFAERYGVAVDYNLGLLNINEEDSEPSIKNRQLVIRFIVSFGRR